VSTLEIPHTEKSNKIKIVIFRSISNQNQSIVWLKSYIVTALERDIIDSE